MQHSFQLTIPLALADIERITNKLRTLPGVQGIDLSPGGRDVRVQFDENATSLADIADAVQYQEIRAPKSKGGCCGGCCGS